MLQKTPFLIFLFITLTAATPVDDCPDGAPQPIHVFIKGCDKQPCPLVRGENVVMIMNFTASEFTTELKARVEAQPEGTSASVVFPLPKPDVCNELINTHCPLEENEPAVYKMVMPIFAFYPKINLRLFFEIRWNGGTKNLVCFAVNCRVVAKPKNLH